MIKILGYHFLVHEGCAIMMFYVPKEPKKFIIEPNGALASRVYLMCGSSYIQSVLIGVEY